MGPEKGDSTYAFCLTYFILLSGQTVLPIYGQGDTTPDLSLTIHDKMTARTAYDSYDW